MAKLLCFAICLIVVSQVISEESEPSRLKPLSRRKRQDEVDIITRGRDGRTLNDIDIITTRSGRRRADDDITTGRRRTSTVRRVVERRPSVRTVGPEIDIITGRRRSGVREIDIIEGGRSGVREIDIIEGGRSGAREIDIVRGSRSGAREIDVIRGGRRSGVREIDIIEGGGRSNVREIDIVERRRTTTGRRDERIRGGGIDEGAAGLDSGIAMPYKFQYYAPNHRSVVERMEEGDADGTVRGFYTMDLGNGLYRYVDYIADSNGYRASIRSNEPGIGGGSNIALEAELPPRDLTDIDIEERRTTTTTTTREDRRPRPPPSTIVAERRTERRRGITNLSGLRLRPLTEEERARRERVIIEEEIIEEPETVIIEEERPETVIIEEIREEPRRVVVEERRTERRERPRIITRTA